jgi:hypothetical protein
MTSTTRTALARAVVPAIPLAFAGVLMFHPSGGDPGNMYEGLRDDVTPWLGVHLAFPLFVAALTAGVIWLLRGLPGRAATVSRIALAPFVLFTIAWEAYVGIGTGLMVHDANGAAPEDRARLADDIQAHWENPILGDPSVFGMVGGLAWVTAMIAAAVAFRRAGASTATVGLVGFASLFMMHPPPFGPIGLVSLAGAAVLIQRRRRVA